MNLDEMNLQQVEERLAALDVEVREATEAEAVEKAAEEKKGLLTRKAELVDLEQRKKTALELNEGKAPEKIIEARKEEKKMEVEKMLDHSSEEYRSAWLKNLQGKELNEVEKRALTGGTSALPEATANKVVEILVDTVPLLNEIELFRMPGSINIAVEVTAPGATREAAGGAVTESTAELRQVTLAGYNMNAFIRLGADLAQQAVSAFEDWLTRKLADAIGNKIEDLIVNGDGSGDPKGIEKYVDTWDVSNGTGVAWTGSSGAALDVDDLDAAIGLLPAKYDRDSKFVMSKKTFYTNVANLTDVNNLPVVEREGRNFYVRGYPVVFSNYVTAGTIFFGDFKRGMVGNLSSNIQVEKQRNLAYNAWDFLGWAVFDCAPAAAGCIVKVAANIQS
jgi:HK97 family phage major capsid protein